ncbi:MAG: GIY-YIG nuclease family protein [Muribaculaceae bacterium]|nr:GIY-YIG nuclease family protein [Muribaculaceae bacterium]
MENSNIKIVSIQTLLKGKNADFDSTPASAIKMVRHADQRVGSKKEVEKKLLIGGQPVPAGISSLYELYIEHRDLFDKYQSEQIKGRFDGVKYMVVFLGEKGTTARFVGVYEIKGRRPSTISANEEVLELSSVAEFKHLEEKIVIDWGKSTVSWHQYFNQLKDVVRIEDGISKADGTPNFKSYQEVILNHRQLVQVMNDKDWERVLKAVNCIYLIVDKSNGKNYVGSTYGAERIYQRWQAYADTGHGDNVELKKLVDADSKYHTRNFQWSILETLPSNITQDEAVERENIWKKKMLSREHGYNKN